MTENENKIIKIAEKKAGKPVTQPDDILSAYRMFANFVADNYPDVLDKFNNL